MLNYNVMFTGTESSTNLMCSYNLSGGIDPYIHDGNWNARWPLSTDLNTADFRYYLRVSISADATGRGTADIKYTVTDFALAYDTAGSAIHAATSAIQTNVGSFGLTGWVSYYGEPGSHTLLGHVVRITNGSFNIVKEDDSHAQVGGAFNVGTELLVGEDVSGNYNLYAIIDGVLIKIDIIPDEIKQALITSGVKFS